MIQKRDIDGYIKLNEVLPKKFMDKFVDRISMLPVHFNFEYLGKKYYAKKVIRTSDEFAELIAAEIAKDFGLPCVEYDLAKHKGNKYVISEDFVKEGTISTMSLTRLIERHYDEWDSRTNLEDIWDCLIKEYYDKETVMKLMNQLVHIFIFDALIGNVDRHSSNLTLVQDESGINFSPLYDNEDFLSVIAIEDQIYSLGVDTLDSFTEEGPEPSKNYLYTLLHDSNEYVLDLLKSKLYVIDQSNIDLIFNRIETRTGIDIPSREKLSVKRKFAINSKKIRETIEKVEEEKKGLSH